MREERPRFEHGVVLVCSGGCGRAQGPLLKDWLKLSLREGGGAASRVRVLATTCHDLCPEDGVCVTLEPGHRSLVADPQSDGPQLLAEIQAHFEAVAKR